MIKSKNNAKALIFKEKISITCLVMFVMALFVIFVSFLVPSLQVKSLKTSAYKTMDSVITNAINATYGYGSTDKINPDVKETIYVYIIDNEDSYFLPSNYENEENKKIFNYMIENYPTIKGRKDFSSSLQDYNGFLCSVMDSDYIESNMDIDKSKELDTVPIDVPDEAIIYACIDRKTQLESQNYSAMVLIVSLLIGWFIMIPIIFLVSNRVMKPTKDTIKHEKDFVANASHELKTPLAIITADAEILKEKNKDNSTYVDNIIAQCKNMNEIVLDMIALSKLEMSDKIKEKVDVSQLYLNSCMSFDAIAFEREIQYEYDIDEDIVIDKVDKKDITRLFNLLCDNAFKYTENEKIIQISLKKHHHGAIFTVYNTGCQVEDDDRERVFERFYQGKSGADKERISSGLGLAIVKQICTKYNFDIKIDSSYHNFMKFTVFMK